MMGSNTRCAELETGRKLGQPLYHCQQERVQRFHPTLAAYSRARMSRIVNRSAS